MDYSWIGNRQLHLAILYSLQLEKNFNIDMFPSFEVKAYRKKRLAEYSFSDNSVSFNEYYIQTRLTTFSHTFFHELAHSTSKYTNRWNRIWANGGFSVNDIVGLEERIADLVAFIWCDIFDKKFDFNQSPHNRKLALKSIFTDNPSRFSLPWKEVEDAVLCLLKNKDCPKVIIALKFYKQLITDNKFCSIKEGIFNG